MGELEEIKNELNILIQEMRQDINNILNKIDEQWINIFDLYAEVKMKRGIK